ncbi:hypothetical protein MUP77_05675 [Candidatus Bathyarchaeota archaeon]|nr:hypothetical protein [Candidatus Bathyarchaeota archaeon]
MPSRKEWTDKHRKLIEDGLEKDGNLEMRKLVAQFSIDNYRRRETVKDFIYTLRDAEIIYIETDASGETIFRGREEAKKQRPKIEIFVDDAKGNSKLVETLKL